MSIYNPQDIIDSYNSAFQQAKAANEARYQQMLGVSNAQIGQYETTTGNINRGWQQILGRQAKVGDSQRADLNAAYARNLGNAQAGLYAHGLGNSTLMASAARGANYDLSRSNIDLNDSLARQYAAVAQGRLGYLAQAQAGLAGLQGDQAQMIERRTDAYPDLGAYSQLAHFAGLGMGAGAGAGGGFVSGGFGAGPRGGGQAMPGSITRGNGDGTYTTYGSGGITTSSMAPQILQNFGTPAYSSSGGEFSSYGGGAGAGLGIGAMGGAAGSAYESMLQNSGQWGGGWGSSPYGGPGGGGAGGGGFGAYASGYNL